MATRNAQAPQAGPLVHPTPSELERFMRGELAGSEACAVVRHLLAGCEACRAVTRRLWRFGEPPEERRAGFDPEGGESMSEIETARKEIREIVRELKPLRLRLSRAVESLPPEPSPLVDAELTDPRTEIRSTVECVLRDSFDPTIRDLERVAGEGGEPA